MGLDSIGLGLAHHHRQAPRSVDLLKDNREQWVSSLTARHWLNGGHAYLDGWGPAATTMLNLRILSADMIAATGRIRSYLPVAPLARARG